MNSLRTWIALTIFSLILTSSTCYAASKVKEIISESKSGNWQLTEYKTGSDYIDDTKSVTAFLKSSTRTNLQVTCFNNKKLQVSITYSMFSSDGLTFSLMSNTNYKIRYRIGKNKPKNETWVNSDTSTLWNKNPHNFLQYLIKHDNNKFYFLAKNQIAIFNIMGASKAINTVLNACK